MAKQRKVIRTDIDPEAEYSVKLLKAVEIGPSVWARPGDMVKMKGKRLAEVIDQVEAFNVV